MDEERRAAIVITILNGDVMLLDYLRPLSSCQARTQLTDID